MVIVLASVLFSFYFVHIANIPLAIKKGFKISFDKRLKPFDCVSCLSVWTAVLLYFLPTIISECLLIFFGSGMLGFLLGILIDKLIYRL